MNCCVVVGSTVAVAGSTSRVVNTGVPFMVSCTVYTTGSMSCPETVTVAVFTPICAPVRVTVLVSV